MLLKFHNALTYINTIDNHYYIGRHYRTAKQLNTNSRSLTFSNFRKDKNTNSNTLFIIYYY